MRKRIAATWWIGFLMCVSVGLLSSPGAAQVQVVASGLTGPFALVVELDGSNVYWTEGIYNSENCYVKRTNKNGGGATTPYQVRCGFTYGPPDLAQDGTFLYFHKHSYPPSETGVVIPQLVRLPKAGLLGPQDLFGFHVDAGPV